MRWVWEYIRKNFVKKKKEKEISLKNYNLNYLLESDLLIRVSFVLQ
jgi:hypothetical protein